MATPEEIEFCRVLHEESEKARAAGINVSRFRQMLATADDVFERMENLLKGKTIPDGFTNCIMAKPPRPDLTLEWFILASPEYDGHFSIESRRNAWDRLDGVGHRHPLPRP